jgi:hypothetical protein
MSDSKRFLKLRYIKVLATDEIKATSLAASGECLIFGAADRLHIEEVWASQAQIHHSRSGKPSSAPFGDRRRLYIEKFSGSCGATKHVDELAIRVLFIFISHASF